MRPYLVFVLLCLSACGATQEAQEAQSTSDSVTQAGESSSGVEAPAPQGEPPLTEARPEDTEAPAPISPSAEEGDAEEAEAPTVPDAADGAAASDASLSDAQALPDADAAPSVVIDAASEGAEVAEAEVQDAALDATPEAGADALSPPLLPATTPPSTLLPPVDRLVAIGDVHGDINALRSALSVAMVIDAEDNWVGGETTVVQVGDQLDRGDDEREILDWLEVLSEQARSAGGAVYPLLGNHEVMNVELNLNYVTSGGFTDFADIPWEDTDPLYEAYPESKRGRVAAFRPGGPYALILARHALALVVGQSLFVHGGVLPEHVAYGLDTINAETRAWMKGEAPHPGILSGSKSPVWSRHYSNAPDASDCALLSETLSALDISRIVVAHTVQEQGITSACQGQAWRVDVGLASYYGGPTQVLLIEGDQVSVLP